MKSFELLRRPLAQDAIQIAQDLLFEHRPVIAPVIVNPALDLSIEHLGNLPQVQMPQG